jgi:hypothetical protein
LIDGEKADDVLSDDTIVDMLRKNGVEIARRTVAKYRDAMNIPSSVQRRREKRLWPPWALKSGYPQRNISPSIDKPEATV